jgi:hypothetical protein
MMHVHGTGGDRRGGHRRESFLYPKIATEKNSEESARDIYEAIEVALMSRSQKHYFFLQGVPQEKEPDDTDDTKIIEDILARARNLAPREKEHLKARLALEADAISKAVFAEIPTNIIACII